MVHLRHLRLRVTVGNPKPALARGETTQQHNLLIVVTATHSRKSTSNRLISTACTPLSFQVKTKMFYNITD